MKFIHLYRQKIFNFLLSILIVILFSHVKFAQKQGVSNGGKVIYNKIKAFSLTAGKADVNGLVLKRDRVTITFGKGTFFFASPVDGRFTGAVFLGEGKLYAEVPPSDFEKEHIRRLFDTDSISSTFKTAILRFSDDTYEIIGKNIIQQAVDDKTQKLANQADIRVGEETGANIPARLALSIINDEKPGVFFAAFSGGKRGDFYYVFDPQTRIPTAFFGIDGGEKGLIYAYDSHSQNKVWTAFYSLDDYKNRTVTYSDMNHLVDTEHYKIDIDMRNPESSVKLTAKVEMKMRKANLRAISFLIDNGLRLKSVQIGARAIDAIHEDWDGQLLVFLPKVVGKAQKLKLEFEMEGHFMVRSNLFKYCYYPNGSGVWYPQHSLSDRSTFEFTFMHPRKLRVVSVGVKKSEKPDLEDKKSTVTKYEMKHPIILPTFAMGPFESHKSQIKWDGENNKSIPLEFNSLPGTYVKIKEEFILAELDNSVRYFNELFGSYPYDTYGATLYPYNVGLGFPSMVMLPLNTDRANKDSFVFISHETAHQWWGNIVFWRSYRDQWLSEGFAEYSGILYTKLRTSSKAGNDLVKSMRASLKWPPQTNTGIGKGRLNDIGPIILGHRLNSSKTQNVYHSLVYNKGALVLRMIHFLLSNPSNGDDKAFYAMMKDFVKKYRNKIASTDDFREVANAHFANTPLAKKYGLKNLNWFFSQWVYKSNLPSYRLEYSYENQPNGAVLVKGNLIQEDVPKNWFMPLPVTLKLGGGKFASGTIPAYGSKTPFQIKISKKPERIELDPQRWVLSAKTSTKKLK